MKGRLFFVSGTLSIAFVSILVIFWYQESQYLLPTPIPANYHQIYPGEAVDMTSIPVQKGKPILLHFFNPECPCSRFNITHFREIIRRYKGKLHYYAVIHTGTKAQFEETYELDIPVIVDTSYTLAQACGVYSTPQAALLDQHGKLYYRGNYNKSRYCTDVNSNFAQMAIDSLLAHKPAPVFVELATRAYGCQLPNE